MTPEKQDVAFARFFASVFDGAIVGAVPHGAGFGVQVVTRAGRFVFDAENTRAVADRVIEIGEQIGDTRAAIVAALLTDQADEADAMEAEYQ